MQDVASECGVSKMCVSLALRDHPGVPARTRHRIKAAAKRLGYTPNPYLSQLMAQIRTGEDRRKCLSVAFLDRFSQDFLATSADPLRHFYIGAIERAKERGFIVYEFPRPNTPAEHKAQRAKLLNLGVDGAILFPFEEASGLVDLNWERYPVVTLGYTYSGNECHRICCNYFRNARIVVEGLARHRRKRIGFLTSPAAHLRTRGHVTGGLLSAAFEYKDLKILPPLVMSEFSPERVIQYIRRTRCDALAVFEAFPVVEALKHKIRIPEDLAVVSCALLDSDKKQKIAGLDEQTELVGRRAFDYLDSLITSYSKGAVSYPNELLVPGKWEDGWTV